MIHTRGVTVVDVLEPAYPDEHVAGTRAALDALELEHDDRVAWVRYRLAYRPAPADVDAELELAVRAGRIPRRPRRRRRSP